MRGRQVAAAPDRSGIALLSLKRNERADAGPGRRRDSERAREDAPFEPSEAMLRYAAACLDLGLSEPAARRKAARVSARALARWQESPDFRAWLKSEVQRHLADAVWETWLSVARLAREGNLTAARLHMSRFDSGVAPVSGDAPVDFLGLAELASEPAED